MSTFSPIARLEFAFGLILIPLGAVIAWAGHEMGLTRFGVPGAGFFPHWLGFALIASGALMALTSWLGRRRNAPLPTAGTMRAILWAVIFLTAMAVFGFVAAAFGYLIWCFRREARIEWRLVIPSAVGALLLIYLVFEVWLRIPLPEGLIGG